MIEPARIVFSNGNEVEAVRATIKDSGWVAINADGDGWIYYPPRQVDRIVSRRADATSE